MKNIFYYQLPLGEIAITEENNKITNVHYQKENYLQTGNEFEEYTLKETEVLKRAYEQLQEYFEGKRKVFTLPLSPKGTPFRQKVWNALQQIPYGVTKNYGEIAKIIGNEKAARAVGQANNKNPISIIIPCHRVIGKNGSLTGYDGGLEIKEFLLKLENNNF
ncbi:methylated-DNA-[protein]-cysteine S-methyltransferase [Desulfonispora thiosulfatigenes DSM 11270]|uniref:Methylated-DNA--protein-cysteine methyltransferase n=1 Tax=Desulfonispora thiosulfatigenes DSM 11270 TaxID=656914 RepID=A0A1W1UY83_DESTI|nr:methylated-DNA--[protein]-cysteine S-methyltransferase [Desulfonispora thiosulfatigenes]SMB86046.1 methylated-DNA-[protein]-cysteine S-methyltransferase [Desulfonispora thiosulfatigenes DSM 11270]